MDSTPQPSPPPALCLACAAAQRERAYAYIAIQRRRLTATQQASVDEEWEHLCQQRGWSHARSPSVPAG